MRTKIRTGLLGLALVLSPMLPAFSEPINPTQRAIQAGLEADARDCARFDSQAVLKRRTQDFREFIQRGTRIDRSNLAEFLEDARSRLRNLVEKDKILQLQVEGQRAYALVEASINYDEIGWLPSQSIPVAVQSITQQVWVQHNGSWKLKESQQLTREETKKGKTRRTNVGYVRVARDTAGKPSELGTAVVRLGNSKGLIVDLVGAVHVGERSYYRELNRIFRGYDAVLYELIAPDDLGYRYIPDPKEPPDNLLGSSQTFLKDLLGLTFQLEEVSYAPKNFVHADLTPDEFFRSMKKRNESPQKMIMQMVSESLADPNLVEPADALALNLALARIALQGPTSREQMILRRVLGVTFQEIDKMSKALEGPSGSTLISVRNQRAVKVLKREVSRGKRRIAVFYGAAHLPDLEKRVTQELGLKRMRVTFLRAWNLQEPPKKAR